jgi:hypothetical protein
MFRRLLVDERTHERLRVGEAQRVAVLEPAPPAQAGASPYCGISWGSQAKSADQGDREMVFDVRAGRHACFDRLVLDFAGDSDGYEVRYVTTLRSPGSGHPVPLRGGARLAVVASAAAPEAESDAPAYRPRHQLPGDR